MAICAGNSPVPVPGEFPAQRPVTRNFDVFFDLRLNKRLSKQSWGWGFETLSRPLWRHCNVLYEFIFKMYIVLILQLKSYSISVIIFMLHSLWLTDCSFDNWATMLWEWLWIQSIQFECIEIYFIHCYEHLHRFLNCYKSCLWCPQVPIHDALPKWHFISVSHNIWAPSNLLPYKASHTGHKNLPGVFSIICSDKV